MCLPCARELHEECMSLEPVPDGLIEEALKNGPPWPCCCKTKENEEDTPIFTEVAAGPPSTDNKKLGRPPKPADQISVSAGRKRAAELYNDQMGDKWPCEWRFMANCGGGAKPIFGCVNGTREAIHHGPVKDTWRNERTNINLICTTCHNRWHTANDPIYDKEVYESLPKNARPMTVAEAFEAIKLYAERS